MEQVVAISSSIKSVMDHIGSNFESEILNAFNNTSTTMASSTQESIHSKLRTANFLRNWGEQNLSSTGESRVYASYDTKFTLVELQQQSDTLGVNPSRKEQYLTHHEFTNVFGMHIQQFEQLPAYKKLWLKKKHILLG